VRTKVYSQLEKLWARHGAQEFGKICQILLGFCLLRLGFKIQIFQLSGRPDMVAIGGDEKLAIEVKTQSSAEAAIKDDDLEGVKEYLDSSIIAVLSYPDLDCLWVLAKADELSPGKWPISFLKQHSIGSLEDQVNEVFPHVLEERLELATLGTKVLYEKLSEEKDLTR